MAKLTAKQQRFCDEYLIDLNATQAAIRAGYSAKNADKIGPELLGKTRVAEYIAERKQDRVARTEITQDRVLRELAIIAFSNAADYANVIEKEAFDDDGEVDEDAVWDAKYDAFMEWLEPYIENLNPEERIAFLQEHMNAEVELSEDELDYEVDIPEDIKNMR